MLYFSFPLDDVLLADVDAVLVEQMRQCKSAHAFLAAHSDSLAVRLTAFDKGRNVIDHRCVDDLIGDKG